MNLDHLDLDVTLGAAQDLAFFDLVFVNVDLSITIGASHQDRASLTG